MPAIAKKFSTSKPSFAFSTTAFAKGCSDDFSKEYAIFKKSCSLISLIISVTFGFPFVIVPVLSKITYLTSPKVCSASAVLNNIPLSAPLPVPTIIATGVASPKAHGQEITKTEIAKLNAVDILSPAIIQPNNVAIAIVIMIGTK